MIRRAFLAAPRILPVAAAILVLKVTAGIVANYRAYIPPDFSAEFLRGREAYFWGPYSLAFYAHIAAGPLTLIFGLLLVNARFRAWAPRLHRHLGRVQVAIILLVVVPSGLVMARHAASGWVAGLGLAVLALATAGTTVMGFRAARARQFARHRRWMARCYLLLCSTVILRLLGGFGVVAGIAWPWFDTLTPWLSWVVPLAIFEINDRTHNALLGLVTFPPARAPSPGPPKGSESRYARSIGDQ